MDPDTVQVMVRVVAVGVVTCRFLTGPGGSVAGYRIQKHHRSECTHPAFVHADKKDTIIKF